VSVCSAKKAIILIFLTKAEIVAKRDGKLVRSINFAMPFPSVIRLARYIKVPFKKIELSRRNILKRDGFRCQYCGTKSHELTIDHIIPKSRGGSDSWDNLVSACKRCNNKKADKTPEESELHLIKRPRRPHHILFITQYMGKVDENWKPFLFME